LTNSGWKIFTPWPRTTLAEIGMQAIVRRYAPGAELVRLRGYNDEMKQNARYNSFLAVSTAQNVEEIF